MEYLKLIKEILAVLSATPLPTIIGIVGLVILVASFAAIKIKPFEVKPRRKVLTTPLVIGAILVAVAILLYSTAPQTLPPTQTPTTTPTVTEPVLSSPTVASSPIASSTIGVTASETPTRTPTSTVEPSSTPTATPLPPTLTPTPRILFQENFLDNKHRWQLISQPRGPQTPGIETNIYGGKFVVSVDCPASYTAATCNVNVPVPYVVIKDFFMEFETSVKRRSQEANIIIGVQFRRTDASYYWFQYKEYGTFLFSLILKGKTLPLSEETLDPSIRTDVGSVNKIGVYAKDSGYNLLANGAELIQVEDGNINQAGDLYIKFHVARNNSATIELDNLIIREIP
jgi:hypothetical protein